MEQQQQNHIAEHLPPLKHDEALCTGCWKVEKKDQRKGWVYFAFKKLQAQDLCPACNVRWRSHFTRLQELGL